MIEWLLRELRAVAADDPGMATLAELEGDAVQICSPYRGRTVWALFHPGAEHPAAIVKVDHVRAQKQRLRREYDALVALDGRSELDGSVPRPLALREVGSRLLLVQSGLPGVPLNALLRRRLWTGQRAAARHHRFALDFLARLRGPGPHDSITIDPDDVLRRAASALRAEGAVDDGLPSKLELMSRSWVELRVPVVLGHGDLSPSNCLVHRGRIGVVDWEGGVYRRPALADAIIFLCRYAFVAPMVRRGMRRAPLVGFHDAFLGRGQLARVTAESYCGEVSRLGLPGHTADFLLIATLTDFASGEARTHRPASIQSQTVWAAALRSYVTHHRASSIRRRLERGFVEPA